MFSPDFINWLAAFRLPEYELTRWTANTNCISTARGRIRPVGMIPALAILNELRSRQGMKGQGRFALGRALCARQGQVVGPKSSASGNWMDCGSLILERGGAMVSCGSAGALRPSRKASAPPSPAPPTSCWRWTMIWSDRGPMPTNCRWWPRRWRNDDTELRWAPYRVSRSVAPYLWRQSPGRPSRRLRHQAISRDAPEWVADWTGFRPDSAPPIAAGERSSSGGNKGRDPREKLLVFSDGMDVGSIEETYRHFDGRVRISFGWGTT